MQGILIMNQSLQGIPRLFKANLRMIKYSLDKYGMDVSISTPGDALRLTQIVFGKQNSKLPSFVPSVVLFFCGYQLD